MYYPKACSGSKGNRSNGRLAAFSAVMFSKEVGFFDVIFEGATLHIVQEVNLETP
jgi:hypothetical protein